MKTNSMMTEYSTVYGRFYTTSGKSINGTATFVPVDRVVVDGGSTLYLDSVVAEVTDGILMNNGEEGVTLAATPSGVSWKVMVSPINFTDVVQSYPGGTTSLGD